MGSDQTHLQREILRRLSEMGIGPKTLAKRAGLNESAVKNILRGQSRNPRSDTLMKLASAFGCTVADLTGEQPDGTGPAVLVQVIGAVEAGAWREAIEWPRTEWRSVPIAPDPRYPLARPWALEVRGNSMDLVFQPGAILVCYDPKEIGRQPTNGSYVIAQRRNTVGLVEATCKQLVVRPDRSRWLQAKSSDPKWADPIPLDGDSDAESIDIIGIVTMEVRVRSLE